MQIQRIPTGSSHVIEAGYDPNTKTLEAMFSKGDVGHYADVPLEKWFEYQAAIEDPDTSSGAWFNKNIRDEFAYKLVTKASGEETPYRKAWREFSMTKEFVDLCNPQTVVDDPKYLINRLETAFAAGWNAKNNPKAVAA